MKKDIDCYVACCKISCMTEHFLKAINIFFKESLVYFATGGGILAIIRTILWMQGLRIISFYRIYRHRKKFYNHPVFTKIENVLHLKYFTANVKDLAKKEIANDLIFLEVYRIKQILNQNLKYIFKKNFFQYIKSFQNFRSETIVSLFIKEYLDSKQELEHFARRRLTKNNYMSQDDFNRFWSVYSEHVTVYEMFIYETLNLYPERKNIYAILWDILDHFDSLIEIKAKTIGNQLNIMNGRLSGIVYKGYTVE